eukprot:4856804-Amphidinium_carterae.1
MGLEVRILRALVEWLVADCTWGYQVWVERSWQAGHCVLNVGTGALQDACRAGGQQGEEEYREANFDHLRMWKV